jgi:hypothetical protein
MVTKLITDRTIDDLHEARAIIAAVRDGTADSDQTANFNNWLRGCWGINDISRIASACIEISTLMNERGSPITLEPVNSYAGYPFILYSLYAMLNNVKKIRSAYPVPPTTPVVPFPPVSTNGSVIAPSFANANSIERVLQDVAALLESEPKLYKYSGTFYAGEAPL